MTSEQWADRDFYADLGVSPEASAEQIRRAYRRLARRYHPDANPGDEDAEQRFKAVSEAYTVLSDPDKRAQYDQTRRWAAGGAGAAGSHTFGTGARTGGSRGSYVDLGDLFGHGGSGMGMADAHALFERLFGGGPTTSTGRPRSSAPWPDIDNTGVDMDVELELDFRTAVRGGTITVQVGDETGGHTQRIRIPPGVSDGQRLRLPGQTDALGRHGTVGELYARIQVRPDEVFGRRGDDLTLTLPVTLPELVLGTQVTVPTLDGTVRVRIPAGSAPGRTLRLPGHGVPGHGRSGDLLVTLNIAVPEHHNHAARQALRTYAEATGDFDPRRTLHQHSRHAA